VKEESGKDLFSSNFFKGSLEGKKLSDFTLDSLKGEKISLSSFKGKIVIIYFDETF
jgi:cytochrome oxidase Cu insertion factor (SCO1/SenC/PrrC family)